MATPSATTTHARPVRPLTAGMRALLWVATVLVLLAGVQLFVFSSRTGEWFAWTIDVQLTAAVLGAAYLSSAAVEATSARAHAWADARVAVPSVFAFTTLTLVVTLAHLDTFHLQADLPAHTRAITVAWLVIYAVVPVAMAVLWLRQQRVPGTDPPRRHPLAPWLRATVAASGVGLLGYGAALLVAPVTAAAGWPWPLTPLTGRAVGAWLVGLGVAAAQVVLESDARRARPVAAGGLVLTALTAVALARYPDAVAWGAISAWVLVTALVLWAGISAAILVSAARPGPGGRSGHE